MQGYKNKPALTVSWAYIDQNSAHTMYKFKSLKRT